MLGQAPTKSSKTKTKVLNTEENLITICPFRMRLTAESAKMEIGNQSKRDKGVKNLNLHHEKI